MANQIFVNPYPRGIDDTLHSNEISGSILLAGAAVATGEPLNWNAMITGVGFNEKNYIGNGTRFNTGSALITTLAASAGTITATAANNFTVGQQVTFKGLTTTIGLLLNGQTVTIVTASSTQFTFVNAATGSGTGETGFAYYGKPYKPLAKPTATLTAPVTSLAVSGGVITVTAANSFLPGSQVTFAGLGTTLGLLLNGNTFTVASSTGTVFTFASTLTGSAGADTGTASGKNPPQPFKVKIWSEAASGYTYQYVQATGNLFVLGVPAIASTPSTASALAPLAAAAYPAGVLSDVIKFEASWARGL